MEKLKLFFKKLFSKAPTEAELKELETARKLQEAIYNFENSENKDYTNHIKLMELEALQIAKMFGSEEYAISINIDRIKNNLGEVKRNFGYDLKIFQMNEKTQCNDSFGTYQPTWEKVKTHIISAFKKRLIDETK